MSYRGLKWLKFNFVIHPDELKEVFQKQNYFIVITNQRVNENYQIHEKTSIFEKYENYYEKIISTREKWIQKEDDKFYISTSITDNPKLIDYKKFEVKEDGITKTFKRAFQLEPVINIVTFSMVIDNKNRISVAFFNPESNLGIQLNYPREIYSFETEEKIITENLSTHKLYKQLIKSIKKISKKAKVRYNGKIVKPNFWISERAMNDIKDNYYLLKNKIEFIN